MYIDDIDKKARDKLGQKLISIKTEYEAIFHDDEEPIIKILAIVGINESSRQRK